MEEFCISDKSPKNVAQYLASISLDNPTCSAIPTPSRRANRKQTVDNMRLHSEPGCETNGDSSRRTGLGGYDTHVRTNMAHPDLEALFETLLPFTKKLLSEHGGFNPWAATKI